MSGPFDSLANRRAIIDRRSLADRLREADRAGAAALLKDALAGGRAEIARRLLDEPYAGTESAAATAFLTDQILRLAHDFVTERLHPVGGRGQPERLLLLALGGYGRGEMAPYSDVDLSFVTPGAPSGRTGQVIESLLYLLWDLSLKIGHSVRSLDEAIAATLDDHTARTAMLESRYVWGDERLHEEVQARFQDEVVAGDVRKFVTEKLEEREARHLRMGDSRYVVEPNVKEGKGGLRDLHALFWIGKYAYRVRSAADLVDVGLLSKTELGQFRRAERFLWAVRCHLHTIAGRAEERLTFDYQREIAERMNYSGRHGNAPVERFMKHYFLHARTVGDLTGAFLAQLDERFARRGRRLMFPALRRRPRNLNGFMLDRGRLAVPSDDFLTEDPVRLIEAFQLADAHNLEIHPMALRAIARQARLIDASVRADPRANALFLDVLTSPRRPDTVLRWMNEAGVFGRFVPDFGRVVAQMQFDMYHHYTVDEHTIRAIGLLARIERGDLKDEHKLATGLIKRIASRRVLYVAVLLHDIAKGRRGDHSIVGAEIARSLCPRFGLSAAETEQVAWLVRWHLLLSSTAQKRDISDPKTIHDFIERVKSLERLRLLYLLTVVDIRAVGPGTWNSWKGQLISNLFEAAEEVLRLGHKQRGRQERIAAVQGDAAAGLGWQEARFSAHAARLADSYWLAEPPQVIERNARFVAQTDAAEGNRQAVELVPQPDRGATLVSVYTPDEPGLFYRIAGAISLSGGTIIDARIHTTADGMALDNLLVQDGAAEPFSEPHSLQRLEQAVRAAVAGQEPPLERLQARALPLLRAEAFAIEPAVFVDNKASGRYTVVEVNARDRDALLCELAKAIFDNEATIRSAHIATYGERAVDVFYLTDRDGRKIESGFHLEAIRSSLVRAALEPERRDSELAAE
ncbi:[protein-PII] uridylyltransferase [Sphingosinicella sp. YJ22]|uniref:[protein-PII] uridylyltransferase n=1 Tax=Sphingosinicella sp. YJ22 TaxID=1104780 RepID=UPI00140B8BEF|nr:[protein-PII] uridylyltransferase [Sphingosinicella sp. YJ22]